MTWASQMCTLVSLPNNYRTNTVRDDWIWSTDTAAPSLLSVYLRTDPDSFHFFIHCFLLDVPNIHGVQRVTSSFISRNIFESTVSFPILKIGLGCK